jgi:hypothetical protein
MAFATSSGHVKRSMWRKNILDVQICVYNVQYISYPHGSCIVFTYKFFCLKDPFNIKEEERGGVDKMKWVLGLQPMCLGDPFNTKEGRVKQSEF